MNWAIIILSVLTLVAASGVIACRRPLNSALCLVLTLFFVAAHFALLQAHFLAAIQIFVYAGAIMVLVIFVIMLLGSESHEKEVTSIARISISTLGIMALIALLSYGLRNAQIAAPAMSAVVDGSTAAVGGTLFKVYLLPFEVVSLIVLAAIIGAVVLAKEKREQLAAGRGLKAIREKLQQEASND